jgi:ankyrin repeat protein
MKTLIDAGADINETDKKGNNALYHAIYSRNIEAAGLLLTCGLNAYTNTLTPPLHTAAYLQNAPILLLLLEHGVGDISARDCLGFTALQNACLWLGKNEAPDLLAILLDHGAAIDQLSRDGKSVLHYAAENGNTAAIVFLLERGADVTLVDRDGQTALHKARTEEVATALLAHGALVDAVDGGGKTPLHHLASHRTEDVVPAARVLLQAGANANATDANGDAPLHCWARERIFHGFESSQGFAQLLLYYGAAAAARNNATRRPSDLVWTGCPNHFFLLAAEEAQLNNHRYKRPRPEDLKPPVAEVAVPSAAEREEEDEEDESEGDSEDEEEDGDD